MSDTRSVLIIDESCLIKSIKNEQDNAVCLGVTASLQQVKAIPSCVSTVILMGFGPPTAILNGLPEQVKTLVLRCTRDGDSKNTTFQFLNGMINSVTRIHIACKMGTNAIVRLSNQITEITYDESLPEDDIRIIKSGIAMRTGSKMNLNVVHKRKIDEAFNPSELETSTAKRLRPDDELLEAKQKITLLEAQLREKDEELAKLKQELEILQSQSAPDELRMSSNARFFGKR